MSSLKISYATFVQFVRPLSAPDNGHHFSSSRFTVMTRLSINCSTCYSCDDTWFALEITGVHCMFILISFWFSHVSDPKGNWKREVYTIKNRDASERLLGPIEKAYLEFPGQKPVQVRQEEVRSSPPNAVVLHTVVQVWSSGRRGARYCYPQLTYWRNLFGNDRGELTVAFRARSFVNGF